MTILLTMDFTFKSNTEPSDFNLHEITWEQATKELKQADPELFKIIELLEPDKTLTLIKARYPFGASIIDNGTLNLPHKSGKSIPIHTATINNNLKKKLSYSSIPLSLPLNKSCEVFVNGGNRVIPLKVISPGWFFGLFEATALLCGMTVEPIWSVSSGARSIFMLPKIADKIGYNRLKKELNIPLNTPRTLADHWELFTLISNHPNYINNWYCDILFFPENWLNKSTTDPKWAAFYNYLFKQTTIQTHYNRDDIAFNLTWQNFIYAIGSRNLRPRPYIVDTAKHLVAIAAGLQPAFCPTDFSEVSAPTKLLQDIYTQSYGLKNYLPTIMHSHILMAGQELCPVYYSLAYPVLQEGLPNFKANPDVISDEREIKLLFDTLGNAIEANRISLPKAYNLLDHRTYEFFHNSADIFNEVRPAKDMLSGDPALVNDKERFPNREFCSTAPFLSGCIRVAITS